MAIYRGNRGAAHRFGYRIVKRAFDIVFSLAVIAVFLVPFLILCLIIRIESPGSPVYTQRRIGKDGRYLNIYKLRTMYIDSDDLEKYFDAEQMYQWRTERKVDGDPRVTKVGHILRKTSLDEFPQFLNVLLGQMSIIGVRPIVDEELEYYGQDLGEFLSMRPGITGWWQVSARNDALYSDGTRQELELYYVRNASLALDAKIFFMTFSSMFKGTGK